MSPERWQRINHLFDLISALPAQDREEALAREVGDDSGLAEEVLRLLRVHEQEGGLLDHTLPDVYQAIRVGQPAVPTRMFAPGDRLAGRFVVDRFLGRGGMGEVYAAYDEELRTRVALKTVRADIASDEVMVDKFRGEVLRARQIAHPNICRVYDLFTDQRDGRQTRFLTMELLEGETLDKLLKRQAPLPPDEALVLLEQMAAGLHAVHGMGLVHRDFKPANVFLVPAGDGTRVVVTDFGLARRASNNGSGETSRTIAPGAGTPAYMAPEQFIGTDLTTAADIYALGLVAYEMVAGAKPFPAESASRRLVEPPPPPAVYVTSLAPAWNEVILQCLARDPVDRPQSALEVPARIKAGQSALRPPSRRWVLGGVAAAVLLMAAGVWYWSQGSGTLEGTAYAQFPALSPDGTQLVYANGPAGKRDLLLRKSPAGTPRNLTAGNPGEDSEPAFSPDGKRLVFYSERGGRKGLHLLDISSGAVTDLGRNGHAPAWAPTGDQIAFVEEAIEDADNRTLARSALSILTLSSNTVRRLEVDDALQPAWSPGGQWIAFLRVQGGARRIHLLNLVNGEIGRLAAGPESQWSPGWSPDGKYIFYCSDTTGIMSLYRQRFEELTGRTVGAPEPVKVPGDYIGPISVARNAWKLAYTQDISTTVLYRMGFDPATGQPGAVEQLPISSSLMLAVELSLAPDARRLVFATQRAKRDLFVVNLDGTELRQITDDFDRDLDPTWSPAGDWIAFQSNRGSPPEKRRYEIHAIRPEGKNRRVLTDTVGLTERSALNPVWNSDGSRLAFTLNGLGLYLTRPKNTPDAAPEQVLDFRTLSGETFIAKSWSRDDRLIAGIRVAPDGHVLGLGVFSLDSLRLRSLTSDGGAAPVWLPDSRFLLYRHDQKIWRIDTLTGAAAPVQTNGRYAVHSSLAVSTDGRSVVFSNLNRKTTVAIADLEPVR